METVYLLLGSNLGDRQGHLRICLTRLSAIGKLTATSSIYETKAWGNDEQPDFLNQVVELRTTDDPDELLTQILSIEIDMGRVRQQQWGSRIIDIDILLFGQTVVDTKRLRIPHVHLPERRFALTPLVEIAPNFIHPILRKSAKELLEVCPDTLAVKRFLD